jgi:hypothetical protein
VVSDKKTEDIFKTKICFVYKMSDRDQIISDIIDLIDDLNRLRNLPANPIPKNLRKGMFRSLPYNRLVFTRKKLYKEIMDQAKETGIIKELSQMSSKSENRE